MDENSLFGQLVQICKPTIDKIEEKRKNMIKPKMFVAHSDAAACNLQENIDFDQETVIDNTIKRWAHLALAHIHTHTDIRLSEFLGAYIDITEEVLIQQNELNTLRTALLETLEVYNKNALSLPIACKILIAGLQETLITQETINPGRTETRKLLSKLLLATSNASVPYAKALVKFIT